jgi:HKD family nuclease
MKLVTNSLELEKEFLRLLKQYKAFYWTAAWAGIGSPVYKELCNQEVKIKQLIIGIHFYQTHPDFIERFLKNKGVKFIKQPEGTFHPKLYLFYDSDSKWELIIGSANFTKQAFSRNTETSILFTSKDSDST